MRKFLNENLWLMLCIILVTLFITDELDIHNLTMQLHNTQTVLRAMGKLQTGHPVILSTEQAEIYKKYYGVEEGK